MLVRQKLFGRFFFTFFLVNVIYVWLDDNFLDFFLVFLIQRYYEVRRKLFEGFFVDFFLKNYLNLSQLDDKSFFLIVYIGQKTF